MENALVSAFCVAIILIAVLTLIMVSINAATTVSESLKDMEEQSASIRLTDIVAALSGNYTGGEIYLMVNNEGQTRLAEFARWDVVAQYQDGTAKYIDYTTDNPPGNNRWTVEGVYLSDGNPEVIDPNILNPKEKMKVVVDLEPEIVNVGRITLSTPNGVTSECLVIRD